MVILVKLLVKVDSDTRIAQGNGRLKAGKVRTRIRVKRDSISLRAIFPQYTCSTAHEQRLRFLRSLLIVNWSLLTL
jgi:hypothetical protein